MTMSIGFHPSADIDWNKTPQFVVANFYAGTGWCVTLSTDALGTFDCVIDEVCHIAGGEVVIKYRFWVDQEEGGGPRDYQDVVDLFSVTSFVVY